MGYYFDKLKEQAEIDYCHSNEKYPLIQKDVTLFTSFQNDGTVEQDTVLCSQCRKANSYGQYGCPRLNEDLPIRKGKVLIQVFADERDSEEVESLYRAGADLEDASAVVLCEGLDLSPDEILEFEYLAPGSTVDMFENVAIFYHA